MTAPWFAIPAGRPQAGVRLFCFPNAGGGAQVFHEWPRALGEDVEVVALTPPGRGRRIGEPGAIDAAAIGRAMLPLLDRPFAVYGHSFGGWLAFEALRELRRLGAPAAELLVVAAAQAPDLPGRDGWFDGLSRVDDATLLQRVVAGGGVPAEVCASPELLQLLLPAFRADFGWLDEYRYVDEPPLGTPILALAGAQDSEATAETLRGWERQTTDTFRLRVFDAGHFFPTERFDELADLLRARLRRLPATADRGAAG